MFRRIKSQDDTVTIYIDDKPFLATAGEPVANVLLNEGFSSVHTAPNGKPRGPYCMMGVCFDCSLEDRAVCHLRHMSGRPVRRARPEA